MQDVPRFGVFFATFFGVDFGDQMSLGPVIRHQSTSAAHPRPITEAPGGIGPTDLGTGATMSTSWTWVRPNYDQDRLTVAGHRFNLRS